MSDTDDTNAWKRFKLGPQAAVEGGGDDAKIYPLPEVSSTVYIQTDGEFKQTPMINEQIVTPAKWDWRIVAAWAAFVIYGIVLELWTLGDGNAATPPLTHVVLKYVPEVVAIGFISWLLYHFATEYWKKNSSNEQ